MRNRNGERGRVGGEDRSRVVSALVAVLAGTFVAASIVLIGAPSVLRTDGQAHEESRRGRRRF